MLGDVWNDIMSFQQASTIKEYMGYPTQKPVALLDRIIKASSNKGDLILDPFCGCGTALFSAQKNERRWIGIDISATACKLMKERLKRECGINARMIRGDVDINYVKKLNPYDFQNWAVVDKFGGNVSRTKSGDKGIDGYTSQLYGGYPIQVKQGTSGVGRPVVQQFESAIRLAKKSKGYIVAFLFSREAIEEVARAKDEDGITIILRTVQDLLDGKIE